MDLVGKTFGYLLITSVNEAKTEAFKRKYYRCRCKLCGRMVSIRHDKFRSGKAVSCKWCALDLHRKPEVIIGKRYGDFIVEECIGYKYEDTHMKYYKVKCSMCGIQKDVSTEAIKNSHMECGECRKRMFLMQKLMRQSLSRHSATAPFAQGSL